MTQILQTGATGLLAHQRKLDVIANNIANLSTTAYKSQQALFSDQIYTKLSNSVGSTGEFLGGLNPKQIGNGVQIAEISSDFSQGLLTNTGRSFDFAIEGDGFFVTSANLQQQFTRDGSFTVDRNGFLVDPATGNYVQRTGVIGEQLGDDTVGFQNGGDSRINIPLGASVAGKASVNSSFTGNLPSLATPPAIEVLTSSSPYTVGGTAANAASLLNDLDVNNADYLAGDELEIVGTDVDGEAFLINLPVDGTTTIADLINAVNAELAGAELDITADGNLQITADESGDAFLSLTISDAAANVGGTDFDNNQMIVETEGKPGDQVQSIIQVFDERGEAHPLNVTLTKVDFNNWDAEFVPVEDNVTMVDGSISNITFNEDGTFQIVNGLGDGDSNIEFTTDSLSTPQTVGVDLSGLTHLATNYSATFDQDGFPPGVIAAIDIDAVGQITGVSTNGRRLDIAQLAIASFANPQGLENVGQNYYVQSADGGVPSIGAGQSGGRGSIRGGQLETSNVDIALEFTQLIVAQRGFSANARSITVATEVIQELNNIF